MSLAAHPLAAHPLAGAGRADSGEPVSFPAPLLPYTFGGSALAGAPFAGAGSAVQTDAGGERKGGRWTFAGAGFAGATMLGVAVRVWPPPFRGPAPVTGLPYDGTPARTLRPQITPGWVQPPTQREHTVCPHADGTPLRVHHAAPWSLVPTQRTHTAVPWLRDAPAAHTQTESPWARVPTQRTHTAVPWPDDLAPAHSATDLAHFGPPPKRLALAAEWGATHPLARLLDALHRSPPPQRTHTRLPWGAAQHLVFFIRPEPDVPGPEPEPDGCYQPPPGDALHFVLDRPAPDPAGDAIHFVLRCPGVELPRRIPNLKVYTMIHAIHVTRLSDGLEIDTARLQIGLDVDAHTWSLSATLLGPQAMAAVQPGPDGEPVTLAVEINGYTWHMLAEEWTETREFAQRGVQVRGRGLSAWLTSPYRQPVSGQIDAPTNVQQAFHALLPVDSGFSVTWDAGLADWTLPDGAWSWGEDTPLSVIHRAATEVGMVVIPDRDARTLRFRPRYPVLPWAYGDATPDLTIPDSAILRLGRQQPLTTQANAVYVHGGDTGGRLVQVSRTGSAADRLAPTQSSDLITDLDAARLLGGRILADEHRQPAARSVTVPLGGDFPLPSLADLVQVDLDGTPERATLNSLSIEATLDNGTARARQTLGFGANPDNTWARFRRLLPRDPLLIGDVTAVHGDNTVTVELVGGGTQRVRGQATVGDTVYIRAGRIEGPAPSLPTDSITV